MESGGGYIVGKNERERKEGGRRKEERKGEFASRGKKYKKERKERIIKRERSNFSK